MAMACSFNRAGNAPRVRRQAGQRCSRGPLGTRLNEPRPTARGISNLVPDECASCEQSKEKSNMKNSLIPHILQFKTLTNWVLVVLTFGVSAACGQEYGDPVVARRPMRLSSGDETLDVIEKGDLLTVLEEQEDSYLVMTCTGGRGLVTKANAVPLADSVGVYDELIKEDPKQGRLYALRAGAWWARGEEQRALQDFELAIQSGYTEPDAYVSRGLLHAALGHHDQAIADYSTAIKRNPQDEAPYINRAAVHMAKQAYELAIKDYSQAIGLNDKKASTYQQRAVAWKLLGMTDKAIEDFGKALELDPRSVPALLGRGYLWFQQNLPKKAIADFTEVIKLQPDAAEAYNNRGFNYRLLGDCGKALADFDRAIKIAPQYALAYQNKAWVLACANEARVRSGKQAIQAATKACELRGYEDVNDLKALAAALAEDGQFDKAIGWQEKVIELVEEEDKPYEREIADKYRSSQPFRLSEPEPGSGPSQEGRE
jgi:tetratricopeptide (TPR) repeat protein